MPRASEMAASWSKYQLEQHSSSLATFFRFVNDLEPHDPAVAELRHELADVLAGLYALARANRGIHEGFSEGLWRTYRTIEIGMSSGGVRLNVDRDLARAIEEALRFFFSWTASSPHRRLERCADERCRSWFVQERFNKIYCGLRCRRSAAAQSKKSTRRSLTASK